MASAATLLLKGIPFPFLASSSSSPAARFSSSSYTRIAPFRVRSMATSADPFKKIQIQRDDTTFDAYVVGKENVPGIVVLQEWWGVDFEIKNHAVHISQLGQGYRALIPDLYRGKVGLDVAEAQHLMDGLDWQGAVKDIRASVNWLKANGCSKVGVTGYCMGGALSIASAVLVPEVDAVVAFYGVPSPELADPAEAKAPIQAHFGELDSFVGFSDITAAKSLEEKLKKSSVPHEVHIYPGCGHAFMNASPEGIKRRKSMGLDDENLTAVDTAWYGCSVVLYGCRESANDLMLARRIGNAYNKILARAKNKDAPQHHRSNLFSPGKLETYMYQYLCETSIINKKLY